MGKSGPCSSRGCGGVGSFRQPLDAGFGVGFSSCAVTGAPLGFPVLDAPRCPLPLTARGQRGSWRTPEACAQLGPRAVMPTGQAPIFWQKAHPKCFI